MRRLEDRRSDDGRRARDTRPVFSLEDAAELARQAYALGAALARETDQLREEYEALQLRLSETRSRAA